MMYDVMSCSRMALAAVVAMGLLGTGAQAASTLTQGDLTFTVLGNGADLVSVSGTGSETDPIVLTETLTGDDVSLDIRGLNDIGNIGDSGYSDSFWIQKVITNNTGTTWESFDFELQSILGTPSTEGDGLSFNQGGTDVFTSDAFSELDQETGSRDFLNFSNGSVADGDTASFTFLISGSNEPAYLRQRPNVEPDGNGGGVIIPTPAAAGAGSMLLAAMGLGYRRRR